MTTDPSQGGGEARARAARRWTLRRAALGVGAAAVVVTGTVVVVQDELANRARQRAHDRLLAQQAAYLNGVRAVADRVRGDVRPVEFVLYALAAPKAGDIFAARDALANDDVLRKLRHDVGQLHHLAVPRGWRDHAKDLDNALSGMRDAVASMADRSEIQNPDLLNTQLLADDGSALSSAIDRWRSGLSSLFVERKEKAPPPPQTYGVDKAGPSVVTWVFSAERACIRANLGYARVADRLKQRPPDLVAFRQVGQLLIETAQRLKSLPVPHADAETLRREVVGQLRVVDAQGRAIVALANRAMAGDQFGAAEALDQLKTTDPAARTQARGFRHVHAIACAAMTSPNGGSGNPKGSIDA